MLKEVVYPVIVAVISTAAALSVPQFITFDTKEQRSVEIQEANIYIQAEAIRDIIANNVNLDEVIDNQKVGWDEFSKKVYGDLAEYLKNKYINGGINLFEFKIVNNGDRIINIDVNRDPALKLYSLSEEGAKILEAKDGKNTIRLIPESPTVLVGSSKLYSGPEIVFSTGDVAYHVDKVNDFNFSLDFFGFSPENNPGITFISYILSFVFIVLAFAIAIFAILRSRSVKVVAWGTTDEEYVKMIRSLRYLRHKKPKRLRQIIRLYRVRDDEAPAVADASASNKSAS